MRYFDLTGRTAVVTGAASGIGLATATRLADAGARVVLADIADAAGPAAALGARFHRTDVTDEDAVRELLASAAVDGPVHVLVQAAGVMTEASLPQLDARELDRLLRINMSGVLFGFKHAPSVMTAGGSIVTIASLAATLGLPGYGAYAASKAAVLALARVAAVEYGPLGIRVNCVCPSSVDTPMLHAQVNGALEAALSKAASPLGTLSSPEHIAALVHFLAADDCPQISGQALAIDAGMTAGYSTELLERLATSLLPV
ncbi:SDR family NAD(P)-dependent oxidoreductase [Pseudonocardia sp. GCM10023141]|uniref:SDR family NAD(P)-dependent oxidoreductase n=1 Tax=Pseudonocardia sp. GCM10023141 TaxID=3252653 RepID=UPI00361D0FC4